MAQTTRLSNGLRSQWKRKGADNPVAAPQVSGRYGKDLKCPIYSPPSSTRADARTFRLPGQTEKFFIHEPTDSKANALRGSHMLIAEEAAPKIVMIALLTMMPPAP